MNANGSGNETPSGDSCALRDKKKKARARSHALKKKEQKASPDKGPEQASSCPQSERPTSVRMDALTVNPLSTSTACVHQGERLECGLRLIEEAHVKVLELNPQPSGAQQSAVAILSYVMLLGHASNKNDASRLSLPVNQIDSLQVGKHAGKQCNSHCKRVDGTFHSSGNNFRMRRHRIDWSPTQTCLIFFLSFFFTKNS